MRFPDCAVSRILVRMSMAELVLALAAPSGNLALDIEARTSTPEEISDRLKSDIDKWRKVTEKAGIQKQ